MAAIDVGSEAINRVSVLLDATIVGKDNPANADGTIDHLDLYIVDYSSGDIDCASFSVVSGDNLSTRGVASGLTPTNNLNEWDAPGDFTAFSIETGDYLGVYIPSTMKIRVASSGGSGMWYEGGHDYIPCTNQLFTAYSGYILSLYGTGVEASAGYTPQIMMFF